MQRLVQVFVLPVLLSPCLAGEPDCQAEGEAVQIDLRHGATKVTDPLASGGKAVRLPGAKDPRGWRAVIHLPKRTMQGKVRFTFHLRGENMAPVDDGLDVYVIALNKKTNLWDFHNSYHVYGCNLKADGYTPIDMTLDVAMKPETYTPSILFGWKIANADARPVAYLDKIELRQPTYDAPLLADVQASRVQYKPNAKAMADVTMFNPLSRAAEVTLTGEDRWGLSGSRRAFMKRLTLAPGKRTSTRIAWTLGAELYGHEIDVTLQYNGKAVGRGRALFVVQRNPQWVFSPNRVDIGTNQRHHLYYLYVDPASLLQENAAIDELRRWHTTKKEYFSWSPGDISDLAPATEVFCGGEGRLRWDSRWRVQRQVKKLDAAGVWPVTYVNGTTWAESGYNLFARHPEWFIYSKDGEISLYDMQRREIFRRRHQAGIDPNSYQRIFFQAVLNHSLPAVQRYIADQYIKTAKVMGFRGVRMDVRYLEVHPGEYDMSGREIAPTDAQADKISARAIATVKRLVHEVVPDFTFGYNYASPDETTHMPLTMKERCRGGGWMLDEVSCTYQEKTSPYHVWRVYVPRMVSWGDQVRRWGGVYNPFDFRRGGAKYTIDRIYSNIFRMIASGRFASLRDTRACWGDLGPLGTRYSEFLVGRHLRWLPKPAGRVKVHARAPLWWQDMVFENKAQDGRKQLIVHLVNPPLSDEVEENPTSAIRAPVRQVRVEATGGPARAWLVASEPDELWGRNQLRATRLPIAKGAVTVPSVLFWKTVIFEW